MKVAIVSTYPPRRCGLATFTTDLRGALREADDGVEVVVAAVLDEPVADPAPEVEVVVRQHVRADYAAAAATLNGAGVDVVLVQHEYGIFGGESGEYLLDLTAALTVPYVVTLHTMLSEPSPTQDAVLRALARGAAQLTVFTTAARDALVRRGVAPWGRVSVVHHGAPAGLQAGPGASRGAAAGADAPEALPELRPHATRRVLSTFGLLSSGKGIEVALRALTAVVPQHPDLLYVVAGRTHPQVVKTHGEAYRESLVRLAASLGLADHVLFLDRYLTDDDIRGLLGRTQVFLTPYRSQEQAVSGVLTFAVVAGCAVVSTPYRYATELLSAGAGRLVPMDDSAAMATALLDLLGNEESLREARRAAHVLGTQYTWPAVGREMLKLLARTAESHEDPGAGSAVLGCGGPPDLTHLERLIDDTGIVQHAVQAEPDLTTGYCVDDVARMLIVADRLAMAQVDGAHWTVVAQRCLTFLEDAWDPGAGAMHNFRSAGGHWSDAPHVGDHLGRAVWALGEVGAGLSSLAPRSRFLLDAVLAARPALSPPRAAAFCVLGLSRLPEHLRGHAGTELLVRLTHALAEQYRAHRSREWSWFEDTLTYDNARLSQALIAAAGPLGAADLLADGLESLEWYAHQCRLDSEGVVLVGNRWRRRGDLSGSGQPSDGDEGDEQPVDAAALAEACVEAYRATGSTTWSRRALDAHAWFHGRNRWAAALYDPRSGGCHDGVGRDGVNRNVGAESTLAHVQAWLALEGVGLVAGRA